MATSVNAGFISSSIRIKFDELDRDVKKVEKTYNDLDGEIKKTLKKTENEIKNIAKVTVQGGLTQEAAIKKVIKLRKDQIKVLQDNAIKRGKASQDELNQIKVLQGDLAKLERTQDKYNDSVEEGSQAVDKQTTSMKSMAIQTALVTAAIVAAKKAIDVYSTTDQKLANVRAVTNATAIEFERLQEAALKAGETTRFTAGNAADALFSLSSAGLDATESIAALDGVLLLAGATGSDLDFTAKTVTATLSQFNLESSKASDIANIFAAANSNSQATLEKLSNAFKQVGPIAGQFGIGVEEVTANLEALFNSGLTGETSGVALRNILLTLTDASSDVSKAFVKTGGVLSDINPRTVGLTGAMENLAASGIDLSDVFDKRAVGAALTLGKAATATEDNLRDLEDAVTGTDEAARQYGVQNETLAGSTDKLKSAAEGLAIVFVDQFAPAIISLQKGLTGLINFLSGVPDFFKGFGAAATVASIGVLALSRAFSVLLGPVGLIITGVTAIVGGLIAIGKEQEKKRTKQLAEDFGDLATEIGLVGEEVDKFVKKAGLVEDALAFNYNLEDLQATVKELSEDLGLTVREVAAIGITSKDVTAEYRAQLVILRDQAIEQELYLANLPKMTSLEKGILESKLAQERLDAKANQDAELKIQADKERITRLEEIKKEVKTLNELQLKGAIDETELIEEKKSLRLEEIEILKSQARSSGEVTDQVLKDIAVQAAIIENYNNRLAELDEERKEAEKDLTGVISDEEKKKQKIREETWGYSRALNRENRQNDIDESKSYLEELTKNWDDYSSQVLSFVSSIGQQLAAQAIQKADQEISELERTRDADIELLDERTRKTLESLGLLEDTKLESLEKQRLAALEEGDQENADLLQKEIDRTKILEAAAAERLAIEKTATEESAKIQYKAELAAWNAKRLSTIASGASAAISSFANAGGFPFGLIPAGLMAGVTIAELVTLNGAKPKQSFDTGGIVLQEPGVASTGDQHRVGVNPKEMILTQQQQATLLKLANGSGGGGTPVIKVYIDGKESADSMGVYYNNGISELNL